MRKNFGAKPICYPMPVLIIATYNADGTADAMNAAWGGISSDTEICICMGENHKTTENLLERKAFTVSFADAKNVVEADYVGITSGKNVPNKLEICGWHCSKSDFVDAPLINELPVALECKMTSYDPETGHLFGEIVNVCADESVLGEDGLIDLGKFQPIIFETVHRGYHVMGKRIGTAFADGKKIK